jgi:hypothetical protein
VGGGRKSKIFNDPALLDDLKALVEPATRFGIPGRNKSESALNCSEPCVKLDSNDCQHYE